MVQDEWWLWPILKYMTIPAPHGHVIMIWALGNWFSLFDSCSIPRSWEHIWWASLPTSHKKVNRKPVEKVTSHSSKSSALAFPSQALRQLHIALLAYLTPSHILLHPTAATPNLTMFLPHLLCHPCTWSLSLTALMLCLLSHPHSLPGHLCIFPYPLYPAESPTSPTMLAPCLPCYLSTLMHAPQIIRHSFCASLDTCASSQAIYTFSHTCPTQQQTPLAHCTHAWRLERLSHVLSLPLQQSSSYCTYLFARLLMSWWDLQFCASFPMDSGCWKLAGTCKEVLV